MTVGSGDVFIDVSRNRLLTRAAPIRAAACSTTVSDCAVIQAAEEIQMAPMKAARVLSIGAMFALSVRDAYMSPPRSAGIFEPDWRIIRTFRFPFSPMK